MQQKEQDRIVEALLFANPEPLTQAQLNKVFDDDAPSLKDSVNRLNKFLSIHDRAYEIISVAGGYQLVTRSEYDVWIRRLLNKSGRLNLSSAALDALAIIAYKQPIGRYDVEAIRGVDSSGVLKTLIIRGLIKIKGRDSGPGRPLLYKTTKKFLEHFGLNRLSDMPKLKEITELIEADPTLGEQMTVFQKPEIGPQFIDPSPE
jgi:segregation and condensation protein B